MVENRAEADNLAEWNGIESNGIEWNWMESNGIEWNGIDWDGMTDELVGWLLVGVESSGHGHPLPLAAGQVDAALADLRLVSGRQRRHVLIQLASPDHVVVSIKSKLLVD